MGVFFFPFYRRDGLTVKITPVAHDELVHFILCDVTLDALVQLERETVWRVPMSDEKTVHFPSTSRTIVAGNPEIVQLQGLIGLNHFL